ncbi:Adrenodoxin protein mitochondrial [Fasciola hepatica]|uniref:Adrenodoxin protein mitochondrial n=1 Tax=Fasciola hepatica TaxID=6192 RepID=A0A4E0RX68_FASHE|nr:Adrenodoxin protein mitochondrial [Fasciola hepatica]
MLLLLQRSFRSWSKCVLHQPVRFPQLHTTSKIFHGKDEKPSQENTEQLVNVHVIRRNGQKCTIQGKIGDNLMYLLQRNNLEVEGACEASLACSTCHVYVSHPFYDKLPEPIEAEDDMLDQAVFLKDNSRLSCQIILTKDLDGIEVTLPKATRNFYVDGHVPKPH